MNRSNSIAETRRGMASRLAVVSWCLQWLAGIVSCVNGAPAAPAPTTDRLTLAPGQRRVCLSLRALSKRVARAAAERISLPDEVRHLAHIDWLEGFIVDDSGPGDIILVGRRSDQRPCMHLDDLIVNMRSLEQGGYPYCSLDPRNEDVLAMKALFASMDAVKSEDDMDAFFEKLKATVGPQQVLIGGVPMNSKHAHVMIDADYLMKKVSQQHVEVPGVTSVLGYSVRAATEAAKAGTVRDASAKMARFWFSIDPHATTDSNYPTGTHYPTFREDDRIVWLEQCPVVVLTQKQKDTSLGELEDVNEDDPQAMEFAAEFSREFPNLTGQIPVFAYLENLFRLRALLLAMDHRGSLARVGWDSQSFLRGFAYQDESPMDPSLPGLANRTEWLDPSTGGQVCITFMVCGGVSMAMEVRDHHLSREHNDWLLSFRTEALHARPTKDSIVWNVRASKKLSIHYPRWLRIREPLTALDGSWEDGSLPAGLARL